MPRSQNRAILPRRENVGFIVAIAALVAATFAAGFAQAEAIKIGIIKNTQSGPLYIAQERNYFAEEGFTATLLAFDAAQPIAVAVVSGDLDFGVAGTTGGLFSLGGQGALRIIGANAHEAPGFQLFAFLASNGAYETGLHSVKDLPGHSVAVTQVGSAYHYSLALFCEKYGIDLKSVRLLPLQAISNIASAITGNQTDAAMLNATATQPLLQRGDAKLISWVGDETPWQAVAVFASAKAADEQRDKVERFLRAYRKGARVYHDAFTGEDGKRQDGPDAPEVAAILAKNVELPAEQVRLGIPYVDADGRLDVKDVLHQIEWYKSQGMVKPEVNGEAIIDRRYVIPLP